MNSRSRVERVAWIVMKAVLILLMVELLVGNWYLRRALHRAEVELSKRCPRPLAPGDYVITNYEGQCQSFTGQGSGPRFRKKGYTS